MGKKWLVPMLVVALLFSLAAPAIAMAKPAKAAKSWRVHNRVVFVQHPITKKQRYVVSADSSASVRAIGWVRPKLKSTDEATLTIVVQKRAAGKWVVDPSAESTASLWTKARDKNRTYYNATVKVPAGRYRIRALLTYMDDKGVERVKRSSFTYFRVVTKK